MEQNQREVVKSQEKCTLPTPNHHMMYSRLVAERLAEYDRLTNNAIEFAGHEDITVLKDLSAEMRCDLEYLETSDSYSREVTWIKQLEVLEEAITWMKDNIRVQIVVATYSKKFHAVTPLLSVTRY